MECNKHSTAANEKILFNLSGPSTDGDNMLTLANNIHLTVFPFLQWELDFLLYCLYRKTQRLKKIMWEPLCLEGAASE